MFHSFLQSRSFVFGYLKKCWAKVQFELDRRAYIKAKRLMDNAIEVITLPLNLAGEGCLWILTVGFLSLNNKTIEYST